MLLHTTSYVDYSSVKFIIMGSLTDAISQKFLAIHYIVHIIVTLSTNYAPITSI